MTSIPGLLWRNGGPAINRNAGSIPFIEDLDALPFPAYDLLDVTKYWRLQPMRSYRRTDTFPFSAAGAVRADVIIVMRCSGSDFGRNRLSGWSPKSSILLKVYGVTDFEFLDDIFNFDRKRVLEVCDLIAKRNLKLRINFPNAVRTDALTEEVMDALVDGLYHSRSPKSAAACKSANAWISTSSPGVSNGLPTAAFYAHGFAMLGFPTETEEEMEMTLER